MKKRGKFFELLDRPFDFSGLVLLLTNLAVLFEVFRSNLGLGSLILIYWGQSGILVFFGPIKILTAGKTQVFDFKPPNKSRLKFTKWRFARTYLILLGGMFVIYGIFVAPIFYYFDDIVKDMAGITITVPFAPLTKKYFLNFRHFSFATIYSPSYII